MRKLTGWVSVGALAAFVLIACGRNTRFVTHLVTKDSQVNQAVHPLKQLEGERKVDILWVVDNSGSMMEHQQNLAANLNTFTAEFQAKGGLEWRFGLLSTSEMDDSIVGMDAHSLLDWTTPQGLERFRVAVEKLGTNGSGEEQAFFPITKHLKHHNGFLRDQATLAIIIVTDAAEQSRVHPQEFYEFLLRAKPNQKLVTYGVFGAADLGCRPTDDHWNYKDSAYEGLVNRTGGKVYKLCDPDFGAHLSDIGKDLVSRIDQPFIRLPSRPINGTISVTYQGKDLVGGPEQTGGYWYHDYDLNRVVFHNLDFAPGDNEEVTLTFETPGE